MYMRAEKQKEWGLLASMLKIGFVGFGGGSALIPVIEKEVVEEQKLVKKEDYDKDVIVASITPGALPVEIATGLGKRAYGLQGMLLSALFMAFPGVLMTVLLVSVLSRLDQTLVRQIECLSIGITAFISCLLTDYARKTLANARKESTLRFKRTWVILAGVFLLTSGKVVYNILGIQAKPFFSLSTIQVLGIAFFGILYTRCRFNKKNSLISVVTIAAYLLCISDIGKKVEGLGYLEWALKLWMLVLAARGMYQSLTDGNAGKKKKAWQPMAKEMAVWIAFTVILSIPAFFVCGDMLTYLARGFASSIISFGGGDAYLSVADGMFVNTGMISETDFYGHLVSIVNVLPGSILCKTLAGVGYYLGYGSSGSVWQGYLVALSGFACSVTASGGIFCFIYYIYACFSRLDVFCLISRWIRPIIAGLLMTVMLSMVYQNVQTGEGLQMGGTVTLVITGIVYALDLLLLRVFKKKNGFLILVSAALSLLLCNAAIAIL